jgi:hypothetical protein
MIATMGIEDIAVNVKEIGLNHDDCKWRGNSEIL